MFCPINICSQATEWRDLAPTQCITGHTPYMQEMANCRTVNLQGKQSPRFRGDWLPHTCPRWLWTLQCWELDSTILVYVIQDYETRTLSQHATLTWMSFHISRHVWWRRDRREGILQFVALPWADCRRAKDSHDLTNIDHCFQTFLHWIFSPKSCVFLKRLIMPAFSFFCKVKIGVVNSDWH